MGEASQIWGEVHAHAWVQLRWYGATPNRLIYSATLRIGRIQWYGARQATEGGDEAPEDQHPEQLEAEAQTTDHGRAERGKRKSTKQCALAVRGSRACEPRGQRTARGAGCCAGDCACRNRKRTV